MRFSDNSAASTAGIVFSTSVTNTYSYTSYTVVGMYCLKHISKKVKELMEQNSYYVNFGVMKVTIKSETNHCNYEKCKAKNNIWTLYLQGTYYYPYYPYISPYPYYPSPPYYPFVYHGAGGTTSYNLTVDTCACAANPMPLVKWVNISA